MPQVNSNRGLDIKFQAGEWYTLYATLFMTLLVVIVVSYYKFVEQPESIWKASKRKKQQ